MTTKQKLSKRHSLSKLAPNWREAIFESIKSERLKLAIAVLSASGCRPSELEKGVAVRLREGILTIGIQGSKVDQVTGRGQPLRLLEIDSNSSWGAFLLQQVGTIESKGLVVQYDAGGVSQRLREKSRQLWPRRKSLVSAYSYRHFLGKSMKESGEDAHKIAATLGHASDFSQTAYGRAGRSKGSAGQHGVISAAASNPVRHSVKLEKLSIMITNKLIKTNQEPTT